MIRVGRVVYGKNGNTTFPSYDGCKPIVVLMNGHGEVY